MVDGVL
jgi:hypothetical protein